MSSGWHHTCIIASYDDVEEELSVYILMDGREVAFNVLKVGAEGINGNVMTVAGLPTSLDITRLRVGSTIGNDPASFHQVSLCELNDLRVWDTSGATASQLKSSLKDLDTRVSLALEVGTHSSSHGSISPDTGLQAQFEVSFDDETDSKYIDTKNHFPDTLHYELPELYAYDLDEVLERATIEQLLVTGPMTVTWNWDKEFKYAVGANFSKVEGTDVSSIQIISMSDEPFLSVFPEGTSQAEALASLSALYTNTPPVVTPIANYFGIGDYWISEGQAIVAGTQFRSADRRRTLGQTTGSFSGDLQGRSTSIKNTIETVVPTPGGATARAYFVDYANGYSQVEWAYEQTRFRAYIPVGDYLDVRWKEDADGDPTTAETDLSPLPANLQLIPDLPEGTRLKVDAGGPTDGGLLGDALNSTISTTGQSFQWDVVGQRLHPLAPNHFLLYWDSAGNEETFSIEIISGWPGQEVELPSRYVLDEQGQRTAQQSTTTTKNFIYDRVVEFSDESLRVDPGEPLELTIPVSGLTEMVDTVELEITGVTHEDISDLHFLLIPPGKNESEGYYLLGDYAPAQLNVSNETLLFTSSDTFIRANFENSAFAGATAGNEKLLNNLAGVILANENLNGDWTLKVADDLDGKEGSIGMAELRISTRSAADILEETEMNGVVVNEVLPEQDIISFSAERTNMQNYTYEWNFLGVDSYNFLNSIEVTFSQVELNPAGGEYNIVLEAPDGVLYSLASGETVTSNITTLNSLKFSSQASSPVDFSAVVDGTTYGGLAGGNTFGTILRNDFSSINGMLPDLGGGLWKVHVQSYDGGGGLITALGGVQITEITEDGSTLANYDLRSVTDSASVSPLAVQNFDGSGYFSIPIDNSASVSGSITALTAELVGLEMTAGDYEVLLQSPDGKVAYLAKGSTASSSVTGFNITLDDEAAGVFDPNVITADGSFKPQAPVPAEIGNHYNSNDGETPIGTELSFFNGWEAAGIWTVFVKGGAITNLEQVSLSFLTTTTTVTGTTAVTFPSSGFNINDNTLVELQETVILPNELMNEDVVLTGLSLSVAGLVHTYIGDLAMGVLSPDGNFNVLYDSFGGSNSVGGETLTFSLVNGGETGTPLTAPLTSTTYLPSNGLSDFTENGYSPVALSTFHNGSVDGTWKFYLKDQASNDQGSVQAVSLTVDYAYNKEVTVTTDLGQLPPTVLPQVPEHTFTFSGVRDSLVDIQLEVSNTSGNLEVADLHLVLEDPDGNRRYLMGGVTNANPLPTDFTITALGTNSLSGNPLDPAINYQIHAYTNDSSRPLAFGGIDSSLPLSDLLIDVPVTTEVNPNGVWKLYSYSSSRKAGGTLDYELKLVTSSKSPATMYSFDAGGAAVPDRSNVVAETFTPDTYVLNIPDSGQIADLNVTVNGLYHENMEELHMVLRSPSGSCVYLLGRAFGANAVTAPGHNITFDDEQAQYAPLSLVPVNVDENYRPTVNGFATLKDADQDNLLDATVAFSDTLSTFSGESITGDWTLIVGDTLGHSRGGMSGFTLAIESSNDLVEDGEVVYQDTATLVGTGAAYPGSPSAHYNYYYHFETDLNGALTAPPIELDANPSDGWYFHALTAYTYESPPVIQANRGQRVRFTHGDKSDSAELSALLYSYRLDDGDVAYGDATREAFAVRVIQGKDLQSDLEVKASDRQVVQRANESGYALPLSAVSTANMAIPDIAAIEDAGFAFEFWLSVETDGAADATLIELANPGYKLELVANQLEGFQDFRLTVPSAAGSQIILIPNVETSRWHHYCLNILPVDGGVGYEFYQDGTQIANSEAIIARQVVSGSFALFTGFTDWTASLDNFRAWESALSTEEVRSSMLEDVSTRTAPLAEITFDSTATVGATQVTAGPLVISMTDTIESVADISDFSIQEVANPLSSPLDYANFNTGWLVNALSNYNAQIYDREAEVGAWGRIFPVNDETLFTDYQNLLEVVYYENPSLGQSYTVRSTVATDVGVEVLHPNVAWPTQLQNHNAVTYPTHSDDAENRIYIASRIGTEGVDVSGAQQQFYTFDIADELSIYNQPSRTLPGFNPNEEHALVAPSIRALLTGEGAENIPPNAAFALQNGLNVTTSSSDFTSQPWVLVQYQNLTTGLTDMASYRVEQTRTTGSAEFPLVDSVTYENLNPYAATGGEAVVGQLYDHNYEFEYYMAAGDLLIPPYPLNLVIGGVSTPGAGGANVVNRALWWDYKGNAYAVSGAGEFIYDYVYPVRSDFDMAGRDSVVNGDQISWMPADTTYMEYGEIGYKSSRSVHYKTYWGYDYPKLKRGETLTYQGGENKVDNPSENGLPALVGMAAAEIVYDSAIPTMVINDNNHDTYSARIVRPLDKLSESIEMSHMPDSLQPSSTANVTVSSERWYFKNLTGSLSNRVYYDSLNQELVLMGRLNEMEIGDSNLATGIQALNVLEPSFLSEAEYLSLRNDPTASGDAMNSQWESAVDNLYKTGQNPDGVKNGTTMYGDIASPVFMQGLMNSADAAAGMTDSFQKKNIVASTAMAQLVTTTAEKDSISSALQAKISSLVASTVSSDEEYIQVQKAFYEQELLDLNSEYNRVSAAGEVQGGVITPSAQFFSVNPSLTFGDADFSPLRSFGVGGALVSGQTELLEDVSSRRFVTIAENNDTRLAGAAVSLHVIELTPARYRGGLKVIEPTDAFSERIEVMHNGDFGGNTEDLFYEWYIRPSAPLDVVASEVATVGTASQDVDWQLYTSGQGLNAIQFEGRPDIALADQMFLMRYRHNSEGASQDYNWNLVSLDSTEATDWTPPTYSGADAYTSAPYQWVGAANSPQLQADGTRRYIPALVMGWVKRVLDRINPYEARYTDMLNNESPAVYSSMLQVLGAPYIGDVALNSSKDYIEGVGLIELYETVMNRAKGLTIDNSNPGAATDGTNQAILLAATRLAMFYELLGSEAYADYLDPTITLDTSGTFDDVFTSTHAFQNQQADLLDEGLALLRGTDFVTSYPSYNRLFWNYVKGLGEAAYNVNYNITDTNLDGFLNEVDAKTLYPMGHGDAWGHYLSASDMHYTLLRHDGYTWRSRDELYSLLDNVIEADYLDEKSFVKVATAKARAGRDIMQETYREAYSADPDGQWQGYEDQNTARAWGVGDWARRAGQGAYFDFAVSHAILPESASDTLQDDFNDGTLTAEGLAKIERLEVEDELAVLSSMMVAIQMTLDESAIGANPLGLPENTVSFDLDPSLMLQDDSDDGQVGHFKQVYKKAVSALQNAERSTRLSSAANQKLRRISDDTASLTAEVYDMDLAYRVQLVEIFGKPHAGNIGFGKPYTEGYDGPDTTFYNYIENNVATDLDVPWNNILEKVRTADGHKFTETSSDIFLADDGDNIVDRLYENVYDDYAGEDDGYLEHFNNHVNLFLNQELDETKGGIVGEAETWREEQAQLLNRISFKADADWGERSAYGELQLLLEEIMVKEIELWNNVDEYGGYIGDYVTTITQAEAAIEIADRMFSSALFVQNYNYINSGVQLAKVAVTGINDVVELTADKLSKAVVEAVPKVVGMSNDVLSTARAGVLAASAGPIVAFQTAQNIVDITADTSETLLGILETDAEMDAVEREGLQSVIDALAEIEYAAGDEGLLRINIIQRVQELEVLRQQYVTKLNEGFALMREREAYNTGVAGDTQMNRYRDMMIRTTRNEAQSKHSVLLENARRYCWLAAKAYEYEVNPEAGSLASATGVLEQIIQASAVGTMVDGEPTVGGGGLSEAMAMLAANFDALEGQLGINNPQEGEELISLRQELFRISDDHTPDRVDASDVLWTEKLKDMTVENLWDVPEFVTYCRPFTEISDQEQPGIVIPFSTSIESGKNFFGHNLLSGDHSFSSSNYSTKIYSLGTWFKGYDETTLASSPRVYLVPAGLDYMRTSGNGSAEVRAWNVQESVIPTPYNLNAADIADVGFIPSFDGVDGVRGQIRRFGDYRAYSTTDAQPDSDGMISDSRLIGRSVWNGKWLLIIPGATLGSDTQASLETFAEEVTDIMLNFNTYSHRGL